MTSIFLHGNLQVEKRYICTYINYTASIVPVVMIFCQDTLYLLHNCFTEFLFKIGIYALKMSSCPDL